MLAEWIVSVMLVVYVASAWKLVMWKLGEKR